MRCIQIYAITLLLSCLFGSVQLSVGNLSYKYYDINELYGISMRQASSVCKDDNGFIWASTKSGVIRLSGDDYRVYQLPFDAPNALTVKLAFTDGVLWGFSNNGLLFRYNPVSDKFLLELNLGKVQNNLHLNVTSALSQGGTKWWMATSDGLFMYNRKLNELNRILNIPVNQLEWFSDEQFFLIALNEISLFNVDTKGKKILYPNLLNTYFETNSAYYDRSRNQLWLGSNSKGLFYYDLDRDIITQFMPGIFPLQPVMDIEAINSKTLLVGVDGQGIWSIDREIMEIDKVDKEDVDNPYSIRGNGVYDIFHDPASNRVWLCTYSGGVSYFDIGSSNIEQLTHRINQPNSLVNNDVNAVMEDSDKNLWFATDNGISIWMLNEQRWKHLNTNKREQAQVFLTLCEDDNGQIWAGTYASGIYVLDRETGNVINHYAQTEPNNPFINDFTFSIYKDSIGDIWIGGINGEVVRYMPRSKQFRKYFFQPVTKIVQYNDSLMLLACSYGLVQLNKNNGEYTTLVENYIVNDIWVGNNEIWLGTSGAGLVCYNTDSHITKTYTTANGLTSNHVNSVAYTGGSFWLGTESGLCRFSPLNENVVTYSNYLPLNPSSFNNNAHCLLSDGRLAMGSNNGVFIFNPSTLKEKPIEGRIHFQNLSILGRSIRDIPSCKLNKPVDQLENLKLKYAQNTITLEILPVGNVSKAKFSWKLEGMDTEWIQASSHRLINYNNIPFGKYDLKIKMFDSSLSQVVAKRSLHLNITPPFWAKWWFLSVMFLLVSTIIYSFFWYSLSSIKQKHTEDKMRFFTNTAHDIRTSLTLIKAPIEELINEKSLSARGKRFVQIANEQAAQLSTVVNQLMDFQKLDIGKQQLNFERVDITTLIKYRIEMFESIAAVKGIQIHKKLKINNYYTAVDVIQIEKVIDNLLSNAIKYSDPNKKVFIELDGNDNFWEFNVRDQGIGISTTDQKLIFKEFFRGENAANSKTVGSGVGLLLVKNIVALHEGTVSFTSEENKGSAFTINIPFKKLKNTSENKPSNTVNKKEIEKTSDETIIEEPDYQNNKTLKILIVEDNDELLRFLRLSYELEYHVITASNGVEAWALAQNELPDLVISDIMMPQMGGFELCKLMKTTFETSHIPIVLLTALNENAMLLHGLGLGADDYLTKPFDANLLHQKIRSIIHNRNAIREKALRLIQTENNEPVLENSLNDQFLKKMLDIVRENLANPQFSRDDFASAMQVSGSLLYKKVKALTDQSPVDFIKSVRMSYALELLQSKKHTVTEVSELCGYASAGYFSTVFRKYFGKSPSEI
jgi:signal transduction histidine kinase/ligand-binding sensor domain-containing protein/DNA-binding NarL/FixJ family response regulator